MKNRMRKRERGGEEGEEEEESNLCKIVNAQ